MTIFKARFLWAAQAVSGVLLVFLLGLHWVAQHYLSESGLRGYVEVVKYLRNPWIFALEAAFLVTVSAHALLGVRAVLVDLNPSPAAQKWLDRALWGIGVLTVAYGVQLVWGIVN